MAKPYYEHAGVQLWHGDCREILPGLGATLLVTDPPFGMKDKTRRGDRKSKCGSTLHSGHYVNHDWDEIAGDDKPFDPSHLLGFDKAVIFGANHFSSRLPSSRCWFVWDKREGTTPDDNADCEFAWTNLDQPARLHSRLWRGLCRRGEENATVLQHPHQKPIGLMLWVIQQCKPEKNDVLVDPYCGSGSTLYASKQLGIQTIGIELEERYCEIAAKRLSQEVFSFEETGACAH